MAFYVYSISYILRSKGWNVTLTLLNTVCMYTCHAEVQSATKQQHMYVQQNCKQHTNRSALHTHSKKQQSKD